MKNFRLRILIFSMMIGMLALTGCSGGFMPSGWPGVSVNEPGNGVYVAYGPSVYHIEMQSGNLIWSFPAEENQAVSFYAPPVTADSQVIIAGFDNNIYSVNPETGNPNGWTFSGPQSRFVAAPLVIDNAIFAPDSDGNLYALDTNGQQLWEPFETEQPLWATPVTDGNLIYLPAMDHNLYALDPKSGSQVWKIDLGSTLLSQPTLDGERLYQGAFGNQFIVVDLASRSTVCSFDTRSWVWASPALAGDLLVGGDIGNKDASAQLYAFNKNNCQPAWNTPFEVDGAIYGTPLVLNDTIYFGTDTGMFYAVRSNGVQQWQKSLGGKIYGSPVLAGDFILVASIDPDTGLKLAALDPEGVVQWTFSPAE